MKTRRFFVLVWRVNALVIFGVGLLAAAVLAFAAWQIYRDQTRTRHVSGVATVAPGEVAGQTAEIGGFEAVSAAGVLRAPLHVRQVQPLRMSSKDAEFVGNYLYFDPATRATHWLRPETKGVLLSTRSLAWPATGPEPRSVAAEVYVAVDEDTSGDGRYSASDSKRIAVSDPDGRNYRIVVARADRVNDVRLLARDRLLILYAVGPRLMGLELDLGAPGAQPQPFQVAAAR